ncbi:transcriptional regulator [Gammaproteobacteria bacterium]|nr:transcriptional regulator [Gammaproteobacteria bacterium]
MMSLPAYKEIQNYILDKIKEGELAEGAQIPTEMELTKLFNVSRMTVNKAIVELSRQKILSRIAGKGTFVTEQKLSSHPMEVSDIKEEIINRGNKHHALVLQQEKIHASESIALFLGIYFNEMIYFCHVLHYENDHPILLEKRYINPLLVPDFIDQNFNIITPSGFLIEKYALMEMEHTIEAISASSEIAEQLQLDIGAPCLNILRRTWSDNGLISFANFVAPGSRYKLHSRILVKN